MTPEPNPRWFVGDYWLVKFEEHGSHTLQLNEAQTTAGDPGRVEIELSGEQAATLAAHALGGAFDEYGENVGVSE